MRRLPVESSTIAAMGYDAKRRVLEIVFRDSGEVYRYFDVPPEEYRSFLDAPSKGAYLNHTFKPRGYPYHPLRK